MRRFAQKLYFPSGAVLGFLITWTILGLEPNLLPEELQLWFGDAVQMSTFHIDTARLTFAMAGALFFGILTTQFAPFQLLLGVLMIGAGVLGAAASVGVFLDVVTITTVISDPFLIGGLAAVGILACATGMHMHPVLLAWASTNAYNVPALWESNDEDMTEVERWHHLRHHVDENRRDLPKS